MSLTRGVHRSSQVEFVPDSNSTQICRVDENGTRNRPGMLVRSTDSGRVGLWIVPVGFGFHRWCRHFGQIRWDRVKSQLKLAGSRWIWTRSRQDLVVSRLIWWISSKFSPENTDFCMFSPENSKYHWKFLVICSSRVARVLGEETRQPTHRSRVLWAATYHLPSKWSVWVVFDSSLGGLLKLVGFRVWLDNPIPNSIKPIP